MCSMYISRNSFSLASYLESSLDSLWGAKEGKEASAELFIVLWLNSNHFSQCDWQRNAFHCDWEYWFLSPFWGTLERHNQSLHFQKTSSSALIIWSIISISAGDLQQSLLQCLYFLSSIGLQICWVKVIVIDQKSEQ